MPALSIGLPVYNGETFLAPAFESLLSQTFSDFELIVSDNASTDGTRSICEKYVRLDSRVRCYRQASVLPPAENHNFVFTMSSAPFFKWATHDDLCEQSYVERCCDALYKDRSAVLAFSKTKVIDSRGATIMPYSFPLRTDGDAAAQRFASLINADHRRHGGFEIYGVIRSEALRRIPPMGNYVGADRILLARLALLGKFHEIDEHLFISREHPGRSVRTPPSGISLARTRWRRLIGVGPLPPLEWWDPSKKGRVNFPEWRIAREYLLSIEAAPLRPADRIRLFAEFARWFVMDSPKLIRDLLIAAEQMTLSNPGFETAR